MALLQRGTLIFLGTMAAWIGYMKLMWEPRQALPFRSERTSHGSLATLKPADFELGGTFTKAERTALEEACKVGIMKKFEADALPTICTCVSDAAADIGSRFDRLANTRYFFNVHKERAITVVRDLRSAGMSDGEIATLLKQTRTH